MMTMAGCYNNETQLYEPMDWIEEADWFDDESGNLYIVPMPHVTCECEGPDNDIMDSINEICRRNRRLTDGDCEQLGLYRVPSILKRFNLKDGYYHA
jgi:hypothetical protein